MRAVMDDTDLKIVMVVLALIIVIAACIGIYTNRGL